MDYKLNERKPSKWLGFLIIVAVSSCIGLMLGLWLVQRTLKPVEPSFEVYVSNGAPEVESAILRPLSASNYMQPFGRGAEDDTPQLAVLPTYSPMVTLHGFYLQVTGDPQQAGMNE